jgi:hypothetical protein
MGYGLSEQSSSVQLESGDTGPEKAQDRRCYDGYGRFLMTVIELPDDQAAALRAKAAAGLTLEDWLNKLATGEPSGERPLQTAADIVLSHMRNVPPEIMATMPKDGASQHDHYIYGRPKR